MWSWLFPTWLQEESIEQHLRSSLSWTRGFPVSPLLIAHLDDICIYNWLFVLFIYNVLGVGVGDFIEKIIDANILAFFQVSGKLSIKKNTFGGYQKIISIEKYESNFIRYTQLKRERMLHIPDKYKILFESSAQSCTAILAEHLG